jgi:nucleotide-binding universal stress UspA family protein
MFGKILVPLDRSSLAEAVLPSVIEASRHFHSQIVLLQVLSTVPLVAIADSEMEQAVLPNISTIAEVLEGEINRAEQYLRRIAARFDGLQVEVSCLVRYGSPADEIIECAREHGVDLIAMSTHGRTGLRRIVLGSVADQVLHRAGIPILLVRPVQQKARQRAVCPEPLAERAGRRNGKR